MNIKASGRSALILATGLFVCLAGPSQAAPNSANAATASTSDGDAGAPVALEKYTKQSARHAKNETHRKAGKETAKGSDTDKAGAADANHGGGATAIPPSVANAKAQLTSADTPAGNAKAMTDRANNILQAAADDPPGAQPAADAQVVSPDQLNDVDRALHDTSAPATAAPATATITMARAAAPAATLSRESSTWEQTSLIGKIFIGFGTLLTMASAARMFMA